MITWKRAAARNTETTRPSNQERSPLPLLAEAVAA